MLKKITAYFLLAIICTQVLPINQVGAQLFNNMITEELCDTMEGGEGSPDAKDLKSKIECLYDRHESVIAVLIMENLQLTQAKETVQSRFEDAPPTRPPLG